MRHDWARDYRGTASVVYGHTPVTEARWVNRTICIDTGCVFGGRLTALRWPERELVSVPAARTYCEPVRPLATAMPSLRERDPGTLDIGDVLGKRIIETRHYRLRHDPRGQRRGGAGNDEPVRGRSEMADLPAADHVALGDVREPGAARAPRGSLRLLPQGRHRPGRVRGEAHGLARRRDRLPRRRCRAAGASASTDAAGIIYTRTGRPFFTDAALQEALLDRVRAALGRAGFWDRFETDWVCLDAELMPWSAKAQALLAGQYAPVGAAARAGFAEAEALLARTAARGVDVAALAQRTSSAGGGGAGLHRRLPPLLLAGRVGGRPPAGAVPPAGDRGPHPCRQGPCLAHGNARRHHRGRRAVRADGLAFG